MCPIVETTALYAHAVGCTLSCMGFFDSPKAPWPATWALIGIGSMSLLKCSGPITATATNAWDSWGDSVTPATAAPVPGSVVVADVPDAAPFLFCPGPVPNTDTFPVERERWMDCDGWMTLDGDLLLTVVGAQGIREGTIESPVYSGDTPSQPRVTVPAAGEPSTPVTPTSAPVSTPGRSAGGWVWFVLKWLLFVGLVGLLARGVYTLLGRPLVRWVKGRKRSPAVDYRNREGRRVAFNTAAESGTTPELLDDCPDPPVRRETVPTRTAPLFIVPTSGNPSDDDEPLPFTDADVSTLFEDDE